MKIHFGHCVGKYDTILQIELDSPVTFVPGSARRSSALCLFFLKSSKEDHIKSVHSIKSVSLE